MRNCKICKGNLVQWNFELLKCESCSTVFSPHIFDEMYNSKMDSEYFNESYSNRFSSRWTRAYEDIKYRRLFSWFNLSSFKENNGNLLEVGIGSGGFLHFTRSRGFAVTGVDLSPFVANSVIEKYSIEVKVGDISKLVFKDKFDVIILNHVLEHVQDPIDFLSTLKTLLNDNGVICTAVPNIGSKHSRFYCWPNYVAYHLSYFNKFSFDEISLRLSMKIEKIGSRDTFSSWPIIFIRSFMTSKRHFSAIRGGGKESNFSGEMGLGVINNLVSFCYNSFLVISGIVLFPWRILNSRNLVGDELLVKLKL